MQNNVHYYSYGLSGYYSLIVNGPLYYHTEILPDKSVRRIQCNINEKTMEILLWNKGTSMLKKLKLNKLKKGSIIDLNDMGERWEGDSLNDKPYGYGCMYDSENRLAYKGFVYCGVKVCYGTQFFSDVGIVQYEGDYYRNMRHGHGKLYDKKSGLVYEGKWVFDKPAYEYERKPEENLKESMISYNIDDITCEDNWSTSYDSFNIIGFERLKKITIGNDCFKNVKEFGIANCNVLEDIKIGVGSFKNNHQDKTMVSHTTYIRDCRRLKRCHFSDGAFGFPSKKLLLQSILKVIVMIVDLPALKELSFGENCFPSHQSLQLTSWFLE